ncbi:putative WD repeat-containing protein 25-like [Apostichopus japonicus]|uniref:Putative WD repeat-containing protein 25-like n=1 Tax=Stichopus japonicus TaxID=307972 RepID=A0A2G8KKD3_STIJA|nr:putative WD repeat-containing protein 25-like [Apostichopus japonicus]
MKRQETSTQGENDGLLPYIPKRKRQQGSNGSKPLNSPGLSSEPGSKIFTLNPSLVCHIGGKVTCKLPRQQNRGDYHGHQKAVTSVEWNVPHYSHLLLTSSLDKEVKIWDCFTKKQCVRTLNCHQASVKSAIWTEDGQNILSGGFDKLVKLTDAQYNRTYQEFELPSFVTCLKMCPSDSQLFLAGTDDSGIYCWDMRIGEIIYRYKGNFGQILALEILPGREEFLASCDFVCRNSGDRNIMVFDLRSTALLSNQIYHEKYTCPSLRGHPDGSVFVAQSNANYAAMFSTKSHRSDSTSSRGLKDIRLKVTK